MAKRNARRRAASSLPSTEAPSTSFYVAAIVVLTFAIFAQLRHAQFLSYDDDVFITANAHVLHADVVWAFTSAELGYYPLTWISHMFDVQLFGLEPGAHHLMNVALHALASVVLFFALRRLTLAQLPSAIVAALFAVHPLHVESVAWIAERRDTLSALFGFLAILVYARRVRSLAGATRTPLRIGAVAFLMLASLLAKQTFVTLPLLLLIIDYWPLQRTGAAELVREKLPLFALSAAAAIVALLGQRNLAAIQSLETQPLSARICNAIVSYATYVGKTFRPADLAIIYPLRPHSMTTVIASGALLLAITAAAWLVRRHAPYILAGWLWFVVALVPLIGIVQIGRQAMADRYTYIPSIGIFVAIVFAAARFAPRNALAIGAAAIIIILAVIAYRQTRYWRDTPTLFTHSVAVTGPSLWADYVLGQALQYSDPDAALPPLRRAAAEAETMSVKSYAIEAHVAATVALLTKAEREQDTHLIDESEREMQAVRRLSPAEPRTQNNAAYAEQLRARILSRFPRR